MRPPSRLVRGLALVVLVALGATSAAAAAPTGAPGGPRPAFAAQPAAATATVTLITGDVVRVHELANGKSAADVTRPEGAKGGVRTMTIRGDLFVYPDEVLPYLAGGLLDKRLFNVTALVKMGYDDAHTGGIPLIVSYQGASARSVPAVTVTKPLPSIRGAAAKADKKKAREFWNSVTTPGVARMGFSKIWLDGKVRADLTTSVPQIGTPQAWAAGYDGSGTKVAVLDTGVDANHPDLVGQVTEAVSFVPDQDVTDRNGHGTHVASTIAGTGAADGKHKGVAPGAKLLVGKVLSNEGFGQDSWIIGGMEWAVAQGADVVSMSLGSQESSDGTDPMAAAVNQLSASSSTLFVVAAGNSGCPGCIGSPGSADAALTVGAVDSSDELAYFSSMGPRFGDQALKPDITAPGVDIEAARSSYVDGSGSYQQMSGTSMATPHVAGAAAILAQEHPDWGGQRIKDALMSSAKAMPGRTAYEVGAGRVDLAAAALGTLTATGSVYFGLFLWPHGSDPLVTRTVTYGNSGDAPVTLDLALDFPAPLVSLSANTVTVPAHGTAEVTLTADPNLGEAGATYLGTLKASDGRGTVRVTNLGLVEEDERYPLTINLTDRAGQPAHGFVMLQTENDFWPIFLEVTGSATVRLPKQTYAASSWLDVPGGGQDSVGVALLLEPQIDLTKATTVNLDARRTARVDVATPLPSEDRQRRMTHYRKLSDFSEIEDGWLVPVTVDSIFVSPTKPVTKGSFEYVTRWRRGVPLLTLLDGVRKVDLIVQQGSQLGTFFEPNIKAVFAGTGSAAEYQALDAKGKVVVIRRSDAVSPADRAAAAVAAGAKLLVVVNDGPGKLTEFGYSGLMVAGVTAAQGNPLIEKAKAGKLKLFALAVQWTPYMYDLVDPHPGSVPANLSYRPTEAQLAQVTSRYHASMPNVGAGFRYDGRPYTRRMVGFLEYQKNPFERVEWVSTPAGTIYHEDNYADGLNWESRGIGDKTYQPGSRQTVNWFGPVVRPRLGLGAWQPVRYPGWDGTPATATWTTINVTPWTDGGLGNAGFQDGSTLDFRLYQGDTLLAQTEWQAIYLDLPTERNDYRLVMDASRPDSWVLSTRTHTEWGFSSAGPTGDQLELIALLQLDYFVNTDLAGDVKAGSKQRIGVAASHMPGVVGAGNVTSTTLEVSFDDGATWQTVTLRAENGGWYADVQMPKDATKFVSLRATAQDDAGGTVKQEVIRAFGLA